MFDNPGYVAGIICVMFVLYIICRLFIKPLKWIFRLLLSCALGTVFMATVNTILLKYGIHYAINPLTSAVCGVLGLPGMVITLILQKFL